MQDYEIPNDDIPHSGSTIFLCLKRDAIGNIEFKKKKCMKIFLANLSMKRHGNSGSLKYVPLKALSAQQMQYRSR